MKLLSTLILNIFILTVYSQNHWVISGCIKDSVSQDPLIGATVAIIETNTGTIANEYGYYTLKLNEGEYNLLISYLGYKPIKANIKLLTDTIGFNFNLQPQIYSEKDIIITAKKNDNVTSTEADIIQLNSKDIKYLPALMGETDFLKIIQLTPGVQASNDANMGFYVRGGGADQNMILFDNIPVYNPSHVMGFFSVFNADAISNAKIIKSGIPANFGGRISSITDISTRAPDLTKYTIKGSIGLLMSKIMLEAPVIKEKISLSVSARRTYLDEVIKPATSPFIGGSSNFYNYSKYHFYDFNSKILWKVNTKNKLEISGYYGQDYYSLEKLKVNFRNKIAWGNKLLSANWICRPTSNWNILATAGYTKYQFNLDANQQDIFIGMISSVDDYTVKTIATYAGNKGQIIKFGTEYTNHVFMPNNLDAKANSLDLNFGSNRMLKAHEAAIYYSHEKNITANTRAIMGVRASYFLHTGPYYDTQKNEIGEIVSSVYYKNNQPIYPYRSIEPRISARYQVNKESSLKASFTMNSQYIHMVSPSSVTLPTDVWLPSTEKVKPQKGSQVTGGYHRYIKNKEYYTSLSGYYKRYYNQIELLYGIVNNFNDNSFEESMTFGDGNSYGTEFYIQKKTGKLNGWFSYTLAWSNRQFNEINNGKIYPAKFDRRHEINIVANYQFSKKFEVSGTFIFASGNAYTLPEYKYIMQGNVISGSDHINGFRMPTYHRMDLSVNYNHRRTSKFESIFNFSVFNVYNRANPFYIYFEIEGNVYEYNLSITPKQVTVFPFLPSLTWIFKF